MTSFHDLLINRRSIRRYTDEPVAADDVRLILEAGLMAPTSKSSRSWQFIAVDDKDMFRFHSFAHTFCFGKYRRCALRGKPPTANLMKT